MGMRILAGIAAAVLIVAWTGDAFARGGGRGGRSGGSSKSHSRSYSAPQYKSSKTSKASKPAKASSRRSTGDLRNSQTENKDNPQPQASGQPVVAPCPPGMAIQAESPSVCR